MGSRVINFSSLLLGMLFMAATLATTSLANVPHPSGSKYDDCCDFCPCTRSIPPQCRCGDVRSYCPSSCERCFCTKSIPPQCRCGDVKDHCDPPCSPSSMLAYH